MTYSQAQKEATDRYMKDRHTFRVFVPKDKADEYKRFAKHEGKSINQVFIDALEEKIASQKQ